MSIGYDPLFSVKNLVIVLTGGCGQIGKVVSRSLYERGAKLVVIDIPAADPHAFAASLGENALGLAGDVTDAGQVADFLTKTLSAFQRVDVLINNHQAKPAGFLDAKAEAFPEELWDTIVDVNLKGTFLMCRDFGSAMIDQGKGAIINLASTYGVVSSNPDLYADNNFGNPVAYSASKGGVVMLSKYLGAYWAEKGVRVNCITPHGIGTKFEPNFEKRFNQKSPMRRTMKADEIVGAVVYLASDASSYVTGSNLLVEGGWTAW